MPDRMQGALARKFLEAAASAQQVEEKDNQSDYEQDMDEAASQVKAEAETTTRIVQSTLAFPSAAGVPDVEKKGTPAIFRVRSNYLEATACAFAPRTALRKDRADSGTAISPFKMRAFEMSRP